MKNLHRLACVVGILFVVLLIGFVLQSKQSVLPVQTPDRPSEIENSADSTTRASQDLVFSCTTDMATEYHIHPFVAVMIDGEKVEIPTDIGIEKSGCMHPIHTHDTTGKIHVESPEAAEFHLSDFFLVWDKPFTKDQIFDSIVDDTHQIRMLVNGKESSEFENLVLNDEDQIVILYESMTP